MKRMSLVAVSALLAMTLSALSGLAVPAYAQSKLHVVATTTQAADAVRVVGGALVELSALMGAGVDPHLYKPTESDIAAMNQAQMVVYSGLHLEGQFDQVFKALSERGITIYALAQPVLDGGYVMDAVGSAGTHDPHFWFDPRNWQLAILGLAEALGKVDPANAAAYKANATAYAEQLDRLFAWATQAMNAIPAAQRTLITSHDAFQYFATAFGWKVEAIQGISTAAEASVADVQAIAAYIIANKIPVIFVESSVPKTTINAVIEAVRAGGSEVRLGLRELYSDAMGAPDEFGGTYIGMFAHNVATIVRSFGVELPAWPDRLMPALPGELLKYPLQLPFSMRGGVGD